MENGNRKEKAMSRDLMFVAFAILVLGLAGYFVMGRGPDEEIPPAATGTAGETGTGETPVPGPDGTTERVPPVDPPLPPPEDFEADAEGEPKPETEADPASGAAPDLAQRISMKFDEATADDVVSWLAQETGIKFETEGDLSKMVFSIQMEDVELKNLLDMLALLNDLTWETTPEGGIKLKAD
jgi:hypothetical protein